MKHPSPCAIALATTLAVGSSLAAESFEPRLADSHSAAEVIRLGRATSLAQADFDSDGVPDLAIAYRYGDRGAVAVFRGEYAALYPHFPASLARRRELSGNPLQPFDPEPIWAESGAAVDSLVAGDFDADGHADLVWTNAGSAQLHFAGGSGDGRFAGWNHRPLPGVPTALGAFDLGFADGLPELVVAVDGQAGKQLLRFDGRLGAFKAEPGRWKLDAGATSLQVARLDEDGYYDLIVGVSGSLHQLPGARENGGRLVPLEGTPSPRTAPRGEGLLAVLPMRLDDNALTDFVTLNESGQVGFELHAPLATYTVNTTDDTNDGSCDAMHCSLREAITAANSSPGADTVTFSIPGTQPFRIEPTTPYPDILQSLTLDGSTQPGFSGSPIVEIFGGSVVAYRGFSFAYSADHSLVRSLVVNGFSNLYGSHHPTAVGFDAPDSVIESCFIGTDVEGHQAIPSQYGIYMSTTADRGLIGGTAAGAGNLVSGHLNVGIAAISDEISIQGNIIGLDRDGDLALGNLNGVSIQGRLVTLGGTVPGTGNLVSGQDSTGVLASSSQTRIQGNRIGTDSSGELARPNRSSGVILTGIEALVGGTSPAASNLVSGNEVAGLQIYSIASRVEKNRFGVSASGGSLRNTGAAIYLNGSRNRVGSDDPAGGNLIANNDSGIQCLAGGANRILGNSVYNNNVTNISCNPPPVLTSAVSGTGGSSIEGTYQNSPNLDFRLEFFHSETCGQGGRPQGKYLLGFQNITTNPYGIATFLFTTPTVVPVGEIVTVTANPLPLVPGDGDTLHATSFSWCQTVAAAPPATAPNLSIPIHIPAGVGSPVTVPVNFTANGIGVSALAFSIDISSCLSFDPADNNADGLPDAVALHLPAGWAATVTYNASDSDGELDFALFDLPTFVPLPTSTVAEVTFGLNCSTNTTPIVVPVPFSLSPSPSFGDLQGQSVAGTFTNGSVDILPGLRGDCNGDGVVDAGDLSACGLEIFDGDGNFWLDVPGGTFPGIPVGCDSNADTLVDAGDLACKIRIIFGQSCAARAAEGSQPALLSLGASELRAGSTVIPIHFDPRGQNLIATAFSLDLAPGATFDAADNDADGIPDSIDVIYPGNIRAITYDPADTNGEIDILLGDVSGAPRALPRGTLLEIRFPATVHPSLVELSTSPSPSFGTATGASAPAQLSTLFSDGFESGDFRGWSFAIP